MSLPDVTVGDVATTAGAASPLHAELARVCAELETPIFGVAGDSNLFFVDSFVARGGRYVAATHEGAAVLMAAGYASTARLGLATITQGAITNAVTALADATRSGLPLVLFAGETPSWDHDNVQRVPTGRIVRSSGAQYMRIEHPDDADGVLALAFRGAWRSQKPVVVGVGSDDMHARCSLSAIEAPARVESNLVPARDAVRAAAAVLSGARRPLILAGRGAISEDDQASLLALARRVGARLATTLRAKGLFRGEASDLGIFGGLADERALPYFDAADVIVAFGAGLTSYTTSQGAATRGKQLIQVDVDVARARSALFVHGSTALTACALLEALARDGLDADRAPWEPAQRPSSDAARPPEVAAAGTVDYVDSLNVLDQVLPADRLLTVDGGRIFFEAVRRLTVGSPRDYVHTMSMGSIGLGLALAMGASVAEPRRLSVLVSGDGGFMLGGLAELATAVRHRLRLIVVVMNDGCYGAEHHQLVSRGHDPATSYFDWPDLAPVARALGAHGVEIRRREDFDQVADCLAAESWPLVVDVKLDPTRIAMDFRRTPPGAEGW